MLLKCDWSVLSMGRDSYCSEVANASHGTADKLVYCHKMIRACIWSRKKRKCRSNAEWSPDVERWESDEDGEEWSDEEDDHALRLEAWVGAGSVRMCV